ncbi:ATP-binding protein [Muricauda sp. 2012CJ35-5]|uniref:histidine kinase n=1 Tax=Flagellimonas spongiicola TaxID=2942208 RepID=A0ABT0PQM5_9FLAO|nr:ATP-binding protein [Allomuricauda spongiicola]MCL6273693.1 ATP-binding protein [Allomuricauda spongiicola]
MPATKILHVDLRKDEQINRYFVDERLNEELDHAALKTLKQLGFFEFSSIADITLGEDNNITYSIPPFQTELITIPENKNEFVRFLDLAIVISKSMAAVHRAGYLFGLLNEERFLIDEKERLIIVGLAAIRKKYNTLNAGAYGKSAYRYMAPEFSSRSNQNPDYRADFYAFGVLLNYWLTGSYFVDAEDEQAIMHQHLTKSYKASENCLWHYTGIYRIISGLLQKNPKERYQSTEGIIKDLVSLRALLDSEDFSKMPELSIYHNPGVLNSEAVLFERENEMRLLTECYEETKKGGVSIAFVESDEGLGKTSFSNQLKNVVTDTEACFFNACSDQFQSSDYLAFHLAFQDIVRRLLMKTGKSHAQLSAIFKTGVGKDLSLLFDVIPDLKELTGFTDSPEQLNPIETQNRFLNVFVRYCGTLGQLGLKRVLFFDDVQWFDESSLNLIRYLTKSQISGVMFILAYNKKFVNENHPLQKLKKDLDKSDYLINHIHLNELSKSATASMVSKILMEQSKPINELSKTIYAKTHGNPQQINNLVQSLYKNNVLYYNEEENKWNYNLNEVKLQEVRENVVEHIEEQIKLQSYQAQVLLKIAAYNNGIFDIPLLATIGDTAPQIITLLLDILSEAGLLTKLDPIHGTYIFNHKRIQKVALELTIPGFSFNNEQLHHKIALYKLRVNNIKHFVELNQFVRHLISSRELLSKNTVNKALKYIVKAGDLATASNSSASAKQYYKFGLDLAVKFNIVEFSFPMLYGLAKAHFLMKNIEKGNEYADKASIASKNKNEKIQLLRLKQDFYEAFTLYDESVDAGISILNLLNETLSRNAIDKGNAMAKRVDAEYNNLMNILQNSYSLESYFEKEMNDGHERDQMNVFANMVISAAHVKKELYLWTVLKMSIHTFKNGLADSSSFAFVHLGSVLINEFNQLQLGIKIINLGMKLLDRSNSEKYISRAILCHYDLVNHFKESYASIQHDLEKRVAEHMKTSDYNSINALCRVSVRNQLLTGKTLTETLNTCEKAIEIMPWEYSECFGAQLVLTKNSLANLLSQKELKSLTSDAGAIETLLKKKCYFILSEQYVFKSLTNCLLGDYKKALFYLNENKKFIGLATSQPQVIRQGMLRVICEFSLGTSPKNKIVVNLEKMRKKIEPWSIECPKNFRADYELIEFLISICNHDFSKALFRLEEGIKWSEREGLINTKALLCDLGSKLLPEENFGFSIKHLKREKQQVIEEWKASLYPQKFDGHSISAPEQQPNHSSFDTQSLLKATQAISAEVNLGSLVQQLLNIVMENAGADKGALILMKNGTPYLESIVNTNSENNSSFSEIELRNCAQLPVNIIEHVISTRKELSIDDVINTNYPKESYFRNNTISSLIILPLLKQKDLVGVLYLENKQVKGLFTEGDLEILRIIASQAAISITNTLLYEKSNTLNQELSSSKEELAKINEVLEDRIKKRTEHLQQEIEMRKKAEKNLIYAKNDADNANSAKTQFLANMSHEIRTPLNAIVGFSQILLNQGKNLDLTQKFERYLNNINQSAESLSEVINDILDLSKIEAGKFTITKEDVNLNQIVTSVCRINKGLGKTKEVKLNSNFNDKLPKYVYTDGSKLKQILMNIIGNAIKFTPEGKNVYVNVQRENSWIVCEVADEGIGIPENQLQHIFNPFIQADAGIDRKFGGTGLGLTITKKLIELLEGKIEVRSQLGQGTSFKIYLPFEKAKNSWIEEKETSLADFKIPPNKKILVVEDNAMNQEMIRALFSELGSEIMLAKDGESGINIAKTYHPEIIFMDVHMPTMDGFETVKRIRKMNNKIPIIGLSADAFTEHREIALNSGFCDYLTKPIQITELVRVLKKYLYVKIENSIPAVKILSEEEKQVLDYAFNSLNQLPIFETEKLVVAAEPLNSILHPDEFNKLEEAIYSGDDEALRTLLSNTINAQ